MNAAEYAAFAHAFIARYQGFVFDKAAKAAYELAERFPELRVFVGTVKTAHERSRRHWWCVTADGVVVDPVADAFSGICDYVGAPAEAA